jgi:hypothetical protein
MYCSSVNRGIAIVFPVLVHALIAAFVVYANRHISSDFTIPSSIVGLNFDRSWHFDPVTDECLDTIPIYSGRPDACIS